MTERQAAYNAETIKPCPFCGEPENLVVAFNPTDIYVKCFTCGSRGPSSNEATNAVLLWNAAANALDAAKAERDEITRDYDLEHNRANILASEIEPLRYELSGRKLEIIAVKQRLEEADARVAELYGKCNSFESLWLAAVKQRDEARAWARKLWREKATLSEPRGKRQYGYRGKVTK